MLFASPEINARANVGTRASASASRSRGGHQTTQVALIDCRLRRVLPLVLVLVLPVLMVVTGRRTSLL